jgi:ABC-2 type transport system permease protein
MLILLGYAATNDVRNIGLVVLDQDQTPASRALIEAYRAADYFRLDYVVSTEEEMRRLIDDNSARAGMIIPAGYGRRIAGWKQADVAFILDGSDPTVASTALAAATLIGQAHATQISAERLEARGLSNAVKLPVLVHTNVWYNPGLVNANFMVPAMIGTILQFLTTMLTSTSIVRERERGTIEQLIVTPLRPWELIIGKLTPYVIIAFINTVEILIVGMLVFRVTIQGDAGLLLALTALFLVTTLGIGLLISTIANTQQEAMLTTLLTLLPTIFLSGFFFPIAAMPAWLQVVSFAIPLRYFLVIARGIVVKGVGMEALWTQVVALLTFAVIVMGAAILRFRKSLD